MKILPIKRVSKYYSKRAWS